MALYSSAQLQVESDQEPLAINTHDGQEIVVFEDLPSEKEVLESTPENTIEISFKLPAIPGSEEDVCLEVDESKEQDSNKAKDFDEWDWAKDGLKSFADWVKKMLVKIPKHSGKDTAGIERAIAYLKKINNEMSKAMQSDFDGHIDAAAIEKFRTEIESGIERCEERLELLKSKKKKKKTATTEETGLTKEAKSTHVGGIIVTVPIFISRIARICINSYVSAGHDIEDCFTRLVKKNNLTDREQAETMQLLADMGYPLRRDRGFHLNEEIEVESPDNFDHAANYQS